MFDQLASEAVVAWYNRLLAREDWARAALATQAGRSARVDAGLGSIFLLVRADGTFAAGSGAPSVTITLAPDALVGALFAPASALRQLRIEGDAAFAQVLTEVLPRLRPDPAEDLARFFGDAPAERMVGTLNAALLQLRDVASRLARQGADYLAAENPLLVDAREFAQFREELAGLCARLDALEARVGARAAGRP